MNATPLAIPEVILFEPTVFGDGRGFFYESFNQKVFEEAVSSSVTFVQDNHSSSSQGVLRGLHYQIQQPQGKLVRVIAGEVLDVAVDLRRHAPTFGQWVSARLSASNRHQLWIPAGFAHGFIVLSEKAEFLYKTTDYYAPQYERSLAWDDPHLGIDWQFEGTPILSSKDQAAKRWSEAEVFDL